jgi:hypothetical protein
MQAIVE